MPEERGFFDRSLDDPGPVELRVDRAPQVVPEEPEDDVEAAPDAL